MRSVIIIPARYASTRLPGKPLADILGKPMVQHVYERAMQVEGIDGVWVATDDQRVMDAVAAFGGRCIMTLPEHASGTDRLVEVMQTVQADIYINLQGDEPLIRPVDVNILLAGMLEGTHIEVGTLHYTIPFAEAANPNVVKMVLSHQGDVLYCSRSLIPYPREMHEQAIYYKHLGVYAYRRATLENYTCLPSSRLEETEKLEQLRLLEAGIKIRSFEVEPTLGKGVDTPACLEKVRRIMAGMADIPEEPSPTLAEVKLVITDVDGVLTDGGIFYDERGECLKRFHVRDGLGIRLLEETGIRVAVLSGRDSATLRKRVEDLGVSLCLFGIKDKATACQQLIAEAKCKPSETVCLGDDSIDLPAFSVCGLAYTVADAPNYIKAKAHITLKNRGGEGAFRELADAILIAQGKADIITSAEGFEQVMTSMAQ